MIRYTVSFENLKMLALLASILLSGCGGGAQRKMSKPLEQQSSFKQEEAKRFALEDDAIVQLPAQSAMGLPFSGEMVQSKLAEIAIPFSTQIIFAYQAYSHSNSKGICAGFESMLDIQTICAFYEREMELLGWHKKSSFESFECAFNFEKPNKTCTIIVRPYQKKSNSSKSYLSIFCS